MPQPNPAKVQSHPEVQGAAELVNSSVVTLPNPTIHHGRVNHRPDATAVLPAINGHIYSYDLAKPMTNITRQPA